ncbi:CHAT domain-containing protein [Catellatospora bangladeshensis]|uniref:CHAT domain-containing protein n=1 Tax=Catellatospora bangladeshensis TaxID=310355 RepID=A0A8J3JNW6_9ACTN|nr:CHAT domain-containing protein [Catellatospora bangladeshensis]GIF82305.1 hypothetical protein Cba03nite_36540 [Catellatospora bangladeshensis]
MSAGRRLPRTSYGYQAPPEARAKGWECNNEECGTGDEPAPRSWPFPCPQCGRPADPAFPEPWAHAARGHQIRHRLTSPDRYRREMAQLEQHEWAYEDAWRRSDHAAADAAWRSYQRARPAGWQTADDWWIASSVMFGMVQVAAEFDDLDRAAAELLECYPFVDTRDVDDDNTTRTLSRNFVSMCVLVLERERSIDRHWETKLLAAMHDVADRIRGVLMDHHHRGFQRISEIRALHRSRAAIAGARRSATSVFEGLPPLTWAAVRGEKPRPPATEDPRGLVGAFGPNPWLALTRADAAIETAEVHGDTGPLEALVQRLDQSGFDPGIVHLARARLHVVTGDLAAALRELDHGSRATGFIARRLRPQILATRGLLQARMGHGSIDQAIGLCRDGRRAGLRWWRQVTPADSALARLLLWRALEPDTPPDRQADDVREAVRLIRRRCRLWHIHGADDRLLLQEALAARDALRGRPDSARRHRAWRNAVDAPWSTAARARLAAAWAQWAAGTGVPEFAAEAYAQLVALTTQDAVARYGAGAKQRVLAAAQEYAEDAGYWLSRAGRFREAVLALETGRAVGLSEVFGRDNAEVLGRLRASGRAGLAEEYQRAIEAFRAKERRPAAELRQSWTALREVARRVAAATGADPLALDVSYADVTAETGDGALVYLAAAKAGGYALVVAATHDPQYVDLPRLGRAAVAEIVAKVLPGADPETRIPRLVRDAPRDVKLVDAAPVSPLADGMRTLWHAGIGNLVWQSARGRVVTLIPVGLLGLLPLHAIGEPGAPGDRFTEGRHVGNFSAIRYAPNARGLRRCRETARGLAGREQTLLAVDVPDGHGLSGGHHLHHVGRETAEVTRRWTGGAAAPVHGCTWAEFKAAAEQHTVWHLACHGAADPDAILDSRLYFADRTITLAELQQELRPGQRRLAVLSACRTNVTGTAMPNEAVGLPSVLIQIGFAGVLATAWAVDDLATTYLMTAFYQRWCHGGEEPAVALNRAQQWLRAATRADLTALLPGVEPAGGAGEHPYADPRYWAAFAYHGA